jgi:hypothetical protein
LKVYLQHKTTKLFLAGNHEWTGLRAGAMEFPTAMEAAEYAKAHALEQMTMLLSYGDAQRDLSFSMGQFANQSHGQEGSSGPQAAHG